jgi:hypothetical protein
VARTEPRDMPVNSDIDVVSGFNGSCRYCRSGVRKASLNWTSMQPAYRMTDEGDSAPSEPMRDAG